MSVFQQDKNDQTRPSYPDKLRPVSEVGILCFEIIPAIIYEETMYKM